LAAADAGAARHRGGLPDRGASPISTGAGTGAGRTAATTARARSVHAVRRGPAEALVELVGPHGLGQVRARALDHDLCRARTFLHGRQTAAASTQRGARRPDRAGSPPRAAAPDTWRATRPGYDG
jgi:hypothetical protein